MGRSPSAPFRPASTSPTADRTSPSTGQGSTRWTRSGSGSAELLEDDSLEIEFEYHHGDEAILKVERTTSSAACLAKKEPTDPDQ